MIYDLAEVEDRGSYYFVLNVTKSSFDSIHQNGTYLKLSHSAYKRINDAIIQKKQVRILKPLSVDEVLPGEVKIEELNNELDYLKDSTFLKIKMLVTPELTKESGFTLYNFIMKNNELSSKGFFIYDENREEKYIEIIETSDEDLINTLESFLECKDKLERASAMLTKLDNVKTNIYQSKTAEEVISEEEKFLTSFYSNY